MREIFFRGKTEDGNWYYGVPLVFTDDYVCMTAPHTYNKMVEANTVGQYTGITDRNGKKVFDGDIVQHFGTYNLEVYIEKGHTKVRWFDTVTNSKETTNFYGADSPYGEFEVIGNIHDNPELLKGGGEE